MPKEPCSIWQAKVTPDDALPWKDIEPRTLDEAALRILEEMPPAKKLDQRWGPSYMLRQDGSWRKDDYII